MSILQRLLLCSYPEWDNNKNQTKTTNKNQKKIPTERKKLHDCCLFFLGKAVGFSKSSLCNSNSLSFSGITLQENFQGSLHMSKNTRRLLKEQIMFFWWQSSQIKDEDAKHVLALLITWKEATFIMILDDFLFNTKPCLCTLIAAVLSHHKDESTLALVSLILL